MKPILLINGGSSSIKFSLYMASKELTLLYDGEVINMGTPEARLRIHETKLNTRRPISTDVSSDDLKTFQQAIKNILHTLMQLNAPLPVAIGHRVVHSGPVLKHHQRITPEVFSKIEQAISFAPLHQPIALEIIKEVSQIFPGVENYAFFDTVFHQKMPLVAKAYPLPEDLRDEGIHRYGFHGLSCDSVIQQFREGRVKGVITPGEVPDRLIIAHLGSGASITALLKGTSIDTTMGLTPCGGIIMGSRSGDLDPGLVIYLLRRMGEVSDASFEALEDLLNKHSGLSALSGLSSDMRILREADKEGDAKATLAIETFVINAKKTIGGFMALLGGVDALVFTGGIGENDSMIRSEICAGPILSSIPTFVLHSEEERVMAKYLTRMLD